MSDSLYLEKDSATIYEELSLDDDYDDDPVEHVSDLNSGREQ
jgi:hypothetical protein